MSNSGHPATPIPSKRRKAPKKSGLSARAREILDRTRRAISGFTLLPTPPAYVQEILDAGPEADLKALQRDMRAASDALRGKSR